MEQTKIVYRNGHFGVAQIYDCYRNPGNVYRIAEFVTPQGHYITLCETLFTNLDKAKAEVDILENTAPEFLAQALWEAGSNG